MYIEGWGVDGFGVFHDYEERGLPEGLCLFLGPNEAGKSTLLAFLRGVLFGFPPRKAALHYPPQHGGRHGGRVFLGGAEGPIAVEREVGTKAPRIIHSDDIESGDVAVRRLLGGVDDTLFRSVFAFSLAELADLGSLSSAGVSERIFSAGIAGAGPIAGSVSKRLEKDASELVRPRSGGLGNELLRRLGEADAAAREAARQAEGYPSWWRKRRRSAPRSNGSRRAGNDADRRERRARLLGDAWPAYHDLRSARERTPDPRGDRRARRAPGTAPTTVCSRSSRARPRPRATVELQRDRLGRSAGAAHHSPTDEAIALQRRLADLGPGWDAERVRGFDASLPRQQEARSWSARSCGRGRGRGRGAARPVRGRRRSRRLDDQIREAEEELGCPTGDRTRTRSTPRTRRSDNSVPTCSRSASWTTTCEVAKRCSTTGAGRCAPRRPPLPAAPWGVVGARVPGGRDPAAGRGRVAGGDDRGSRRPGGRGGGGRARGGGHGGAGVGGTRRAAAAGRRPRRRRHAGRHRRDGDRDRRTPGAPATVRGRYRHGRCRGGPACRAELCRCGVSGPPSSPSCVVRRRPEDRPSSAWPGWWPQREGARAALAEADVAVVAAAGGPTRRPRRVGRHSGRRPVCPSAWPRTMPPTCCVPSRLHRTRSGMPMRSAGSTSRCCVWSTSGRPRRANCLPAADAVAGRPEAASGRSAAPAPQRRTPSPAPSWWPVIEQLAARCSRALQARDEVEERLRVLAERIRAREEDLAVRVGHGPEAASLLAELETGRSGRLGSRGRARGRRGGRCTG